MQQNISPRAGTAQLATACQLFLSHLIASGATLVIFCWLTSTGLPSPQPLSIALITGGILGLLLSLNVLYNLQLLQLILTRFSQALPVEEIGTFWRWPFTSLFVQLYRLSERIKAYQQQAQMTDEFREQILRQASEAAALEERNRIAQDLHDSIKQQIFSISISAAAAKAHMNGTGNDAENALEAVADIQQSVKEAQVEMRALLQQLRSSPLENTHLREALETQAQALGYRTGAHVHVEIAEMPTTDQLPPGAQEAIFRLVQESFANIARHARAETIWLKLYQREKQLHVEIRDDGQGFNPQVVQKGMGLNNLQERTQTMHGTLNIQSAVGKGTSISVIVPLLDALPAPEEQERQQLEIRRMVEQTYWYDQLTRTMIPVIIGILLLHVPSTAIILAAGVLIYSYAMFLYAKTRVKLLTGKESMEMRSLQRREYGVYLQIIWFLLFLVYHFYNELNIWQYPMAIWPLLAVTLLTAIFTLFTLKQRYHVIHRYYAILPKPRLNWELEQDRKRSIRLIRIWLIIIALNLIDQRSFLMTSLIIVFKLAVQHASLNVPFNISSGVIMLSVAAIILIWGLIPCLDYLQISRWRQHLALMQAKKGL